MAGEEYGGAEESTFQGNVGQHPAVAQLRARRQLGGCFAMTIEDRLEEIIRRVVREELRSQQRAQPEELLTAADVARFLGVNKQKVYSLAREHEIEPVMISKREMRFSPEIVRDFQLRKGIKAA